MQFTAKQKEDIFLERTRTKYPQVWEHYTKHVAHELMSEDELAAYNFEQRRKIVAYAYENVPFYRRLYDAAGFSPQDLRTEQDWQNIPVVTKPMIRENFADTIAGGLDGDLVRNYSRKLATGGSTGIPLPIIRDMRYEQAGSTLWRSRGWWLGRPAGELTGPIPVLGQDEGIVWRVKGVNVKTPEELEEERRLYFPMKRSYLDAQNMSAENMTRFYEELHTGGGATFRDTPEQ